MISEALDKQTFVDTAAEEIDAKLGFVYDLPLRLLADPPVDPVTEDSWKDLPAYQVKLLKGINNRLASGRLILAIDIAGEQNTMHAYGWQLVKEATAELLMIANGDVDLDAARRTIEGTEPDRTPSIYNYDEESLLLGFEDNIMRRHGPWTRTYSQPGAAAKGPFF
jgi:hypothetical protein